MRMGMGVTIIVVEKFLAIVLLVIKTWQVPRQHLHQKTRSRIVLDYTTISATYLLVRKFCSSMCQLNQSKAQGSDLVHDLQHLHSAIWYLADAMIMRLKLFNCTYACARAVMPVLRQPLACESSSRLTGLLTDPLCPSSACRFLQGPV